MSKPTDIRVTSAHLDLLPVQTRLPLKFGSETLTHITCARVRVSVVDREGRSAEGWGETPLSVQWAWPSNSSYQQRYDAMVSFCRLLTDAYPSCDFTGHPMEIGHDFLEESLPRLLQRFNASRVGLEAMPHLAALICASAFDIAIHDAFGVLHEIPIYDTYNARFMNRDLAHFLRPAPGVAVRFAGRFPDDFLAKPRKNVLPAWHLVGGKDWLEPSDQDGPAPDDGYPTIFWDWIRRDGLKCLKIKLRGNDAVWDYRRLVDVGRIAEEEGADWLSTDFNCTVTEVDYVNDILDRLMAEHPRIYGMILYVEQPFPYDLEGQGIDVHSLSARKPLFMDESAHDWKLIELGRRLGWNGVALKTCKTQTGALLSLCWAKAHGMSLMVQDLTNPMLAQIPHVLLAAHAGTIMGVETNAMQFYPDASREQAKVHPGLYVRRKGVVTLDTVQGPGFGYQLKGAACSIS